MNNTFKRIGALTIVILWGLLIIATLIAALVDSDFTRTIFPGLVFTVIGLPVVAYAMLLVYRILNGNKDKKQN